MKKYEPNILSSYEDKGQVDWTLGCISSEIPEEFRMFRYFHVHSTHINKYTGCTLLRLGFCIFKPEVFVARVPFWGYTVRTTDNIYLIILNYISL